MIYSSNNSFTVGVAVLLAGRRSYRMVDRIETPKDERAILYTGKCSSAIMDCAVCNANNVMR